MHERLAARILVAIVLLCSTCFDNAVAGGPILGARSTGMGTAFTAVADDPSAISVNPAGLVQISGTEVYGGLTFIIPSTEYRDSTGLNEKTEFQIFSPPHLYMVSGIDSNTLSFGLGIYSLYGIGGRKWDDNGLTRYSSTESFIATISFNPSIAWKVSPVLSVGAGLNYMVSRMNSGRKIDQSVFGAGDGEMKFKGTGDGWGYNFGILLTPGDNINLGMAYRSRIRVTHKGELEVNQIAPAIQPLFGGSCFRTDAETPSDFPEIVSLGIAYRPIKQWTLGLDFEWFGWSSFKEAEMKIEKEVPGANLTDSSAKLDWKDVWTVKAGTEYKISEEVALRAGYAYIETQVPEHTLNASTPDSNQHNFSLGIGYRMDKLKVDIFYMAGFFEDRKVENKMQNGTYENFNHYFGFSVGKKF
jgi:long-chain fatty acid transport protein